MIFFYFYDKVLCGDCRKDVIWGDFTTMTHFKLATRPEARRCDYCGATDEAQPA